MHTIIKVGISVVIILAATAIGKKIPSLAGLIAVMPLTGCLVLVWLYMESQGDSKTMEAFTKGALGGIVPSVLFFVAAWLCFRKQLALPIVLAVGFAVWLGAAFVHQWLFK